MFGALIPLIVSNVLHMVLVKKNRWSALAKPINARAFGENKTWRGVVFVSFVNGLLYCLINWPGGAWMSFLPPFALKDLGFLFFVGWLYGMAYVIFELPNSWIKRKMGIAPGESSTKYRGFFALMDKTDSALGVSLVFAIFHDMQWDLAGRFFLCASLLHIVFSLILKAIRIKKSF